MDQSLNRVAKVLSMEGVKFAQPLESKDNIPCEAEGSAQ